MSTVKHPEEKKLLSLKHDRRNTYGENAKASRKSIPRGKRRSNKVTRALVAAVLHTQFGPSANLDVDTAEALVKARTIKSKRKGFRKQSDEPLIQVLLSKRTNESLWPYKPLNSMSPDRIDRLHEKLKNS